MTVPDCRIPNQGIKQCKKAGKHLKNGFFIKNPFFEQLSVFILSDRLLRDESVLLLKQ